MTDQRPYRRGFEAQRSSFDRTPLGAHVYNTANIPVLNGSAPMLTFNAQRTNDGAFHSTSVNPSRLTAPIDRSYGIGASIEWAAAANGRRQLALVVNGSLVIQVAEADYTPAGGVPINLSVYTEFVLLAGDYVEVRAYQTSGGTLNVVANSAWSPEFWITSL